MVDAWTQLRAYDPDVIVVGPCGFGVERAVIDTQALWGRAPGEVTGGVATAAGNGSEIEGGLPGRWWEELRAVRAGEVYALDANAYCARPGPRLVQGTALIAGVLHGPQLREWLGPRLCPEDGWARVPPPNKLT